MDCSPPGSASMGFSREQYWSGLPSPFPADLPNQGANSSLLHWQADSFPLSHQGSPRMHLGGKSGSISEVYVACFKAEPAVGTATLPGLRWGGALHLSRAPCPLARRPACFPEVRMFALTGTLSAPRAQL